MISSDSLRRLARAIDRNCDGDGLHKTCVPGLQCLKFSAPGSSVPTVYQPSICILAQGAKRVVVENEIYPYAASQYLGVSVDLPVLGEVTEADAQNPYLCLQVDLHAREITELLEQMDHKPSARDDATRGIFVGTADQALMDSIVRLVALIDAPADVPLLAPLAFREVYYRLLKSEHGDRIAQLGVPDGRLQRVIRVLQELRVDVARVMRIEEMAELARMSPSSFHHYFKQVTAMTPLQYQKRLRLMEARRILLSENVDASSTAYRVGYESPSQFSREYHRMFGAPPIRDVEMLRRGAATS